MQNNEPETFAVGSPFEDEGKGAIYIYYPSKQNDIIIILTSSFYHITFRNHARMRNNEL